MKNLADIQTFESTPWQQRCGGENVYELLLNSAKKFPERIALSLQPDADPTTASIDLNYRQLLGAIHQTANFLFNAGVGIGGVTSLLMPNLPQTHIAMWAAETLGIAGPINPMLEPQAIRDILRESGSEALVVLGPVGEPGIWEKALSILDEVPSLKQVLVVSAQKPVPTHTPGGIAIVDFDQSISSQNAGSLDFERKISPEDIAAYFHTGGTTGTPKLAQHRHSNQVFLASTMSDMFGFDENSVALCGLPLFHVNSVFVTGLNIFARGGRVVLLTQQGFRAPDILKNLWLHVQKFKANFFSAVPTIISALLSFGLTQRELADSLRFVVCGAAPIAPDTLRRFKEMSGVEILEGYGMTEGTCSSSVNPEHGEKRIGSIGLRIPYQDMKCVELDENGQYLRDCGTDEPGIIVIRGPNVFPGYKQTEKNTDAFIGDWLVTGDLGRQDVDGYFWLTGRAKDLIIRGGHNIDPKVIEDCLSSHPAVDLAAAVGQPDAYAGELPCAYVTIQTGEETTVDELREYLVARIPERAAIPVHLEILSVMPVTAVGKIFKPALRHLAITRVVKSLISEAGVQANVFVSDSKLHGASVELVGDFESQKAKAALKDLPLHVEFRGQA